jgi:hypothetical protein
VVHSVSIGVISQNVQGVLASQIEELGGAGRSAVWYRFVSYCHHPALVHSEFATVVVPEEAFASWCGRPKVWSDVLCALQASGRMAKTLLVLIISSSTCELRPPNCLEHAGCS